MIPVSDWVWQGHAAHFCASSSCLFRMATRVGDYIISTVGEYWPDGAEKMERIGAGDKSFYETFVFPAGKEIECGCTAVASLSEMEGVRYATAREAQEGHMDMCRKYARRKTNSAT
jgi:hypothetical protein